MSAKVNNWNAHTVLVRRKINTTIFETYLVLNKTEYIAISWDAEMPTLSADI